MNRRRGLAVLGCVAVLLAAGVAPAGHEIPLYPSFYPQEITLVVVEPAAAPGLLEHNAIHAYAAPLGGAQPGHTAWVESLRSFVILTFNPASPGLADSGQRCAAAARVLPALAASRGDYTFHPYPVTPYHESYLHHFDLAEAAKKKAAGPRGDGPALRIRVTGRLAEILDGSGWRRAEAEWDAALEEIALRDLMAQEATQLSGWTGPPWLKSGWFQAHAVYARGVSEAGARSAIEAAFAHRLRGGFASPAEVLNLERRLIWLLTRGCERVAVGYTVRREAINDDYSEGVENIGWDAQAGLSSAVFLRTVKLKDFPWNGWLRLGVASRPAAAWNPVAGFADETGRLVWAALGDFALLPAPYGDGWVPNRVRALPPPGPTEGEVPPDALVPDPATGALRPAGAGVTARHMVTYRVMLSKFHDGTKMTTADLVYPFAFAYRWSARDPEIARATGVLRQWLAGVRVVKVDAEIKDFGELQVVYEIPEVEVYLKHGAEPGLAPAIAPPWSAVPWELLALMEEAVTRGLAAFSPAEAKRRGVPWLDLARDARMKKALGTLLHELERRAFVPEALRGLVTAEQARLRWAALRRFSERHGHLLVSNGPYRLVRWSGKSVVLGVFRDLSYPNTVGSFDGYALPLRAWVTTAERQGDRLEFQADAERVSKFARSFKIVREPYRLEATGEQRRDTLVARYAVLGAGGAVVAAGRSEQVEGGRLIVDLKGKLGPGAYDVLVALALNGNVVNPEVKVIPFRVGE